MAKVLKSVVFVFIFLNAQLGRLGSDLFIFNEFVIFVIKCLLWECFT